MLPGGGFDFFEEVTLTSHDLDGMYHFLEAASGLTEPVCVYRVGCLVSSREIDVDDPGSLGVE